jgi:hypothetical protein
LKFLQRSQRKAALESARLFFTVVKTIAPPAAAAAVSIHFMISDWVGVPARRTARHFGLVAADFTGFTRLMLVNSK